MRVDSRELPLSVFSCFHVILGLPGPCFPSACMYRLSWLHPSSVPHQGNLLSFRIRSRSSIPGCASSSLDLMVTVLRLDIADLSDHCPVILLQTLEIWHCQWPSLTGMEHCIPHTSCACCVLKERWWEERTGSSSLNFFQAVFTRVVVESWQPLAAGSMSPR